MENQYVCVRDVDWCVNDRYLITKYVEYLITHTQICFEWKCLEISPNGCVKIRNEMTKKEKWLLPEFKLVITDVIKHRE